MTRKRRNLSAGHMNSARWSGMTTRGGGILRRARRVAMESTSIAQGQGTLVVEIFDVLRPGVGTLEVESSRFEDSSFRLADVHALEANSDISQCIREGGYRNRRNYKIWEWPALKWLRDTMQEQISFEYSNDLISVWPALDGYCLHLSGTDVFYTVKHAEVLGDTFNPKRVSN